MSRWGEAFRVAIVKSDSVETMASAAAPTAHSVNRVNGVTGVGSWAHPPGPANDPATDLAGPRAPCPSCGAGLWWRLSILSGGPGPWTCKRCAPPDPADWLDGCAVP